MTDLRKLEKESLDKAKEIMCYYKTAIVYNLRAIFSTNGWSVQTNEELSLIRDRPQRVLI